MKRKECSLVFFFFFLVTAVFFYKTFLHGYVPFPGDLLISEYNPWKTYSYLGYTPGSFPNKGQYFDVLRQIYPWKTMSIQLLKHGVIPLWNPYDFSGTPLLANFQSAIVYPLNFFYFLFSQMQAWTVLIFLQPLFAGFFTYLFTRKIGTSKIGATFSAVSFAFSSFLTVWLEYNTVDQVLLWLPLILLSVEYIVEKAKDKRSNSLFWNILFLFSVVSSLFAGHIQIFGYIFIFTVMYIFVRVFLFIENKKKLLIRFGLLMLFSLGIGAVQIIPGVELIQLSARSAHNYNDIIQKILIQPWQLVMLFIPDFFGNPATRNYWPLDTYIGKVTSIGIIPLFFAFFTFTHWENFFIRFFLSTVVVILFLTTNNPITAILYRVQIPIFSSSAPTLSIFLFCFSLSILAGFGVDVFQKEKKSLKRFLFTAVPVLVLFLTIGTLVFLEPTLVLLQGVDHATIAMHAIIYSAGIFLTAFLLLVVSLKKKKIIFLILIFLLFLSIFDSWRLFQRFNPFVPSEMVFPSAPVLSFLKDHSWDRFWGVGSANIEANFPTQNSLFSPEGYDPLYAKRYGEFIQSSQNGKIITSFTDKTRSDGVIHPASNTDFYTNRYRQRVLQVLGVAYVLDRTENGSTEKTFPPDIFKLVYADSGWKIYKNTLAAPRAFFLSHYTIFHSTQEFEKNFFAPSFDPRQSILLEQSLPVHLSATSSTVHLKSYAPNGAAFTTQTNGNGLLFLSDTYYPGWEAQIDGQETPVYRADYDFRAIVVPQGLHHVTFTFNSTSFKIGSVISLFSLIALIGWICSLYFNDISKEKIPNS